MIEIAGLAVAGISALGTIVQAYYSAKAKHTNISQKTLKQAEKRAETPLKTGIKKVDQVIDDRLLIALQEQIDEQNNELIKAFRNTVTTDAEKERLVEKARLQICHFLSEVKSYNEDRLPTERLKKLWLSNRCQNKQGSYI